MKQDSSFNKLIEQLQKGDGNGIAVSPEGEIVPASAAKPPVPRSDLEAQPQQATATEIRKTAWGSLNRGGTCAQLSGSHVGHCVRVMEGFDR